MSNEQSSKTNLKENSFNGFIKKNSEKLHVKNIFGDDMIFKSKDISFIHKTHCKDEWEIGLNNGCRFSMSDKEEAQKVIDIFNGE